MQCRTWWARIVLHPWTQAQVGWPVCGCTWFILVFFFSFRPRMRMWLAEAREGLFGCLLMSGDAFDRGSPIEAFAKVG